MGALFELVESTRHVGNRLRLAQMRCVCFTTDHYLVSPYSRIRGRRRGQSALSTRLSSLCNLRANRQKPGRAPPPRTCARDECAEPHAGARVSTLTLTNFGDKIRHVVVELGSFDAKLSFETRGTPLARQAGNG